MKLYENFEKYYSLISYEDYCNLRGREMDEWNEVRISQNEFHKIKNLVGNFFVKLSTKNDTFRSYPDYANGVSVEISIDTIKVKTDPLTKFTNYNLSINKLKDDWWIVDYEERSLFEEGNKGKERSMVKFLKDKILQ